MQRMGHEALGSIIQLGFGRSPYWHDSHINDITGLTIDGHQLIDEELRDLDIEINGPLNQPSESRKVEPVGPASANRLKNKVD